MIWWRVILKHYAHSLSAISCLSVNNTLALRYDCSSWAVIVCAGRTFMHVGIFTDPHYSKKHPCGGGFECVFDAWVFHLTSFAKKERFFFEIYFSIGSSLLSLRRSWLSIRSFLLAHLLRATVLAESFRRGRIYEVYGYGTLCVCNATMSFLHEHRRYNNNTANAVRFLIFYFYWYGCGLSLI